MKYQTERPSWKELTVLHNQASTLALRIEFLEQDRQSFVEFMQGDFFKELSEDAQNVILESLDRKDRAIARRKDEYSTLVQMLSVMATHV